MTPSDPRCESLRSPQKLYFNSDEWQTYLRSPHAAARPQLNGRPLFLAGWLDQSYWPDGVYTAPTEEALVFDLRAVAALGMNTVRLHQKVNPERWYYAADVLGVLVMQDAVQKYGGATNATIPLFESDLVAMIRSRGNHPSIIQWETFNEQDCYAVFDTPPHSVADVVALARRTDWQDRPVDTDSGGGANYDEAGDVNDIHSYPYPGNPLPSRTKYAMIGEFGGVGTFTEGKEWVPGGCYTYLHVNTSQLVAETYVNMTDRMLREQLPRGLASSIYTQITDVELECDGFFNYDRTPKLSESQTRAVAQANRRLIEVGSGPWPAPPSVRAAAPSYDSWKLVLLEEAAAAHSAVCLDGSAPGYYVERGTARGILLHLQGGGWCTTLADCAGRARSELGSSTTYARDRDSVLDGYDGGAHGLFSNRSEVNPHFHNWTKVYVRYCDGGSFSGDALATAPDGTTLHFRGRRILDAVLDALVESEGFAAGDVLLANGCSAGGLAVWLHLDYMQAHLSAKLRSRADVRGIPECGLFMDLPTASGSPHMTPAYRAVAEMQNATSADGNLDADCLAAYPAAEQWRCFLAQYVLPHVSTPFFAVNSVYDSWQTVHILQADPNCATHDPTKCTPAEAAAIERLRTTMLGNLSAAPSSFFTYNCATHCGQLSHDDRWAELEDGAQSLRERLSRWVLDGEAHRSVAPTGWGPAEQPSCS